MKNALSLILALMLCLSLCACVDENINTVDTTSDLVETSIPSAETSSVLVETQPQKEDLIADAIITDVMTLQRAAASNRLKAKADYCNKPIIVTGKAISIKDDYVKICDSQASVYAYLSIDELLKIKYGDRITVVGIISDLTEVEEVIAGTVWKWPVYIMEVAYLIEE